MGKKLAIVILIGLGVVFLPTTIFLAFGMMPTIVSFITDKTLGKTRTMCVGFMNFAGCFPFLLDLWTEVASPTAETAFRMAADVQSVITIYVIAAGGYAIDVAVTGIASSIIIQKSQSRYKNIKSEQEDLIKKWGDKVTGKYNLDDLGFPINK
jgi:hypothetical protein